MKELYKKSVDTINYWIVIIELFFCFAFKLLNKTEIASITWYFVFLISFLWAILDLIKLEKKESYANIVFDTSRVITRFLSSGLFLLLGVDFTDSKSSWFIVIFFIVIVSVAFSRTYETWASLTKQYFFKRKNIKDDLRKFVNLLVPIVILCLIFLFALYIDDYLNDDFLKAYPSSDISEVISRLIVERNRVIFIIYYSLLLHIDSLFDFTLQIAILYISCFIAIVSIFKTKIHGIEIGLLYRWFCRKTLYFTSLTLPLILAGVAYIAYVSNYLMVLLLILFYYVNVAAIYIYFVFRIHDDIYFMNIVIMRIEIEIKYLNLHSIDYHLFQKEQEPPEINEFCERFLDFPISIIAKESIDDKKLLEFISKISLKFIKIKRKQLEKQEVISYMSNEYLFSLGYIYLNLLESMDIVGANISDKRCKILLRIIKSIHIEKLRDLIAHITLIYFAINVNNDIEFYEEPFTVYEDKKSNRQFWHNLLIILNAIARSDNVDISNITRSVRYLSKHRNSAKSIEFDEYKMYDFYIRFWKLIYQEREIELDIRRNCDSCADYYFNLEVIKCGKREPMFFIYDEVV